MITRAQRRWRKNQWRQGLRPVSAIFYMNLRRPSAKAQRTQNQPDIGQAKPHAVQPIDKRAHVLERPQFSLKAVRAGLVQPCACQLFELPCLQPCGSLWRGHVPQRVNTAFIENFFPPILPPIHRLPGHARSVCNLGRLLALFVAVGQREYAFSTPRPISLSASPTPQRSSATIECISLRLVVFGS